MAPDGISAWLDQERVPGQSLWTTRGDLDATSTRSVVAQLGERFAALPEPRLVIIAGDTSPRTATAVVAAQLAGCVVGVVDKRLPVGFVGELLRTVGPVAIAYRHRRSAMAEEAPPGCIRFDLDALYDEFDHRSNPIVTMATHRSGPAMVLFSSGSSGEPKGVVQSHENIAAEALRYQEWLDPQADTCLGVVSSLGFTSSPASLAAMWRFGGRLAFYDVHRRGMTGLVAFLRTARVTNLRVQSAVLRSMCELDGLRSTALRSVSVAGEPLFRADVERFRASFPPTCNLHLAYSSTETGTIAEKMIRSTDPLPESCNRLTPTTGTIVRIVDPCGHDVPPGEVGEVVVSSASVALGYLNRPDLTAERFFEDAGRRWVRTRDAGRWLEGGAFALAGRVDGRLKVRGYNVEPVVVEEALMRHPSVRSCAVVGGPRPGGGTLAVAYVVAPFTERPAVGELRNFLAGQLPGHLVPSVFQIVDDLPRVGTGKIDRTLLTERAGVRRFHLDPAAAPETDRERFVHSIVARLLGIDAIGVDDDLLDLGLDSLMVAELAVRLEAVGESVSVASLLVTPTIRAIADISVTSVPTLVRLVPRPRLRDGEQLTVLVPGAGASVAYLRPLAYELIQLGPVLGVNTAAAGSIADVARTVCADLVQILSSAAPAEGEFESDRSGGVSASKGRASRPQGDPAAVRVVVMGHSWGGVVAIEVVRELQSRGVVVDRLVLLDSAEPDVCGATRVGRLRRSLRNLVRPAHAVDASAAEAPRVIERDTMSRAGDRTFNRQMADLARRVVRPIAVDTVLVRTGLREDVEPHSDWRRLVSGRFMIVSAGGRHTSMLSDPFVSDLGSVLRTELAGAPTLSGGPAHR